MFKRVHNTQVLKYLKPWYRYNRIILIKKIKIICFIGYNIRDSLGF